jgi:hypothetical protein
MFIIAVDPGKTCGLAVYNVTTKEMQGTEIDFNDFGDWLNTSLHNLKDADIPVVVVVERFQIGAATIKRSQDAHWALEAIGVARYVTKCYGFEFMMQVPSVAKNFATDVKLQKAGWYIKGKGHANDAIRHASLAMADLKIAPPWATRRVPSIPTTKDE